MWYWGGLRLDVAELCMALGVHDGGGPMEGSGGGQYVMTLAGHRGRRCILRGVYGDLLRKASWAWGAGYC